LNDFPGAADEKKPPFTTEWRLYQSNLDLEFVYTIVPQFALKEPLGSLGIAVVEKSTVTSNEPSSDHSNWHIIQVQFRSFCVFNVNPAHCLFLLCLQLYRTFG
jgi:hypothetical protein